MNPLLEKYLKDKFGENYDKSSQDDYSEKERAINAGSIASSFGDALAGRAPGSQNEYFNGLKKEAKANTIGKVDLAKKDFAVDYDLDRKIAEDSREDDQLRSDADEKSESSKIAQSLAVKMGMNPEQAKTLTAVKWKSYSPALEKMYQVEQNKLARQDSLNAKKQERLGVNKDILKLPAENQEVIKDLARGNAGKHSIANQIDSVTSNWNSLTDDQKLTQGQQLLKTLNSTQGSDAVGAEEVKRLGGKLEFAMGNIFNSNPTQFGRDLPGFKDQADLTSKAIRGGITSNNDTIDKMYHDSGVEKDSNSGYRDPKIEQMAKESGVPYETALGVFNSRKSKMVGR